MRGTTHWAECWREHPECAKRRAEELEAKLARWKPVIEAAKEWRKAQSAYGTMHERVRVDGVGEWDQEVADAAQVGWHNTLIEAIDAALKEGSDA
jgi:hypothetical protein